MVSFPSPPASPASSPASSFSSLSSLGSCDDGPPMSPTGSSKGSNSIKFMCSYGGRILPRQLDGKLRYVGGSNRVLTADRSTQFSELMAKMEDMCGLGKGAGLRCQLPAMDLDALVSVSSDEDLANLVEEYDLVAKGKGFPPKIRAFLHPTPVVGPKSPARKLPTSPPYSRGRSPLSPTSGGGTCRPIPLGIPRRTAAGVMLCQIHQRQPYHYPGMQPQPQQPMQPPQLSPQYLKHPQQAARLVHNGNHWQ